MSTRRWLTPSRNVSLCLQNTPLDSFTATELLRMYIYSDPKRTEAFGSVDLLTRMSEVNLFCFSLEDKVHILEFLCQQILATNELGAGAINEVELTLFSLSLSLSLFSKQNS